MAGFAGRQGLAISHHHGGRGTEREIIHGVIDIGETGHGGHSPRAQLALIAQLGKIGVDVANIHRKGRIARIPGLMTTQIQPHGVVRIADTDAEAIDGPGVFGSGQLAFGGFDIPAIFMGGQGLHDPAIIGQTGQAGCLDSVRARAIAQGEFALRVKGVARTKGHGFENDIGTAGQARSTADRGEATGKFDALDQAARGIAERRVHQVGTARMEALMIDAHGDTVPEQAAILKLAGQWTIGGEGGAGQAGDQAGGVRCRGGQGVRTQKLGRIRCDARGRDGDDVCKDRLAGRRGLGLSQAGGCTDEGGQACRSQNGCTHDNTPHGPDAPVPI